MVHCADNLIVLGRLAGQQTGFNRMLKAKVVYVRSSAVRWTSLSPRVCSGVKCNEFKSFINETYSSSPPLRSSGLFLGPTQSSIHFVLEVKRPLREAVHSSPSSSED